MSEIKYKLKLEGTVSDGKYTQKFTEKDVDHIEFSFGNKKIAIGDSVKHALKLEELVKKSIKEWEDDKDFDIPYLKQHIEEYQVLTSLLEEAKK